MGDPARLVFMAKGNSNPKRTKTLPLRLKVTKSQTEEET